MSYPGDIVSVMTSIALQYWRNRRLDYLDDLLVAHRLVRGTAIGRRRRMPAVNAALVLRLAAEFQGFARDLHEEASATFASWIVTGNLVARSAAYDLLVNGAKLSALKASGCHTVLGTVRRWRRDTDVLASNLDVAVGDWLGQAFGRSNPW
jgi:hypothetical protein